MSATVTLVGEYPCNRVEHRSLAIAATTMTEHEGVLEHTSSQAVAEPALNKLLEFNVAVERYGPGMQTIAGAPTLRAPFRTLRAS